VLGLKLVAPVIYTFGTAQQKAHYLPRILSGEDYWCQGFSEPASGSDLASLQCRAVRDGDRYMSQRIQDLDHPCPLGQPHVLPGAHRCQRAQERRHFVLLVDMNQPGISVRPILTLAGDHEVNQVFLEDVVVPVTDLVGAEGDGWKLAKFLLENERGGSCHAPKLAYDLRRIEADAADQPDGAWRHHGRQCRMAPPRGAHGWDRWR
jgi:alkylation response protein AidB-like acyl-CoA dehydrogenase